MNSDNQITILYVLLLLVPLIIRKSLPKMPSTVIQIFVSICIISSFKASLNEDITLRISFFYQLGVALFLLLHSMRVKMSSSDFMVKFFHFGLAISSLMFVNFLILMLPNFSDSISSTMGGSIILSFTSTPILLLILESLSLSDEIKIFALDYTLVSEIVSWLSLFILSIIIDFNYLSIIGLLVSFIIAIISSKIKNTGFSRKQSVLISCILVISLIGINNMLHFSLGASCIMIGVMMNNELMSDGTINELIDIIEVIFMPLIFIDLIMLFNVGDLDLLDQIILLSMNYLATLMVTSFLAFWYGINDKFLLSNLLNCGGVIQIIIASILREEGVISGKMTTLICFNSMTTTIITPIVFLLLGCTSGGNAILVAAGNSHDLTVVSMNDHVYRRHVERLKHPTIVGFFEDMSKSVNEIENDMIELDSPDNKNNEP